MEGAGRLAGNSHPTPQPGACPEKGREHPVLFPAKTSTPTHGRAQGSLSPLTFFLGSGGGLGAAFGGLVMPLVCSSLMAMMAEECTMVRWGVRPRCRQLRMC